VGRRRLRGHARGGGIAPQRRVLLLLLLLLLGRHGQRVQRSRGHDGNVTLGAGHGCPRTAAAATTRYCKLPL
jgi:hypothetical protein